METRVEAMYAPNRLTLTGPSTDVTPLPMETIALVLKHAGFALYALPILGTTLALTLRWSGPWDRHLSRFVALGPVLGLSLGSAIFGGLAELWLRESGFPLLSESNRAQTIAFGFLWLSNLQLEVWTLEPVRKAADSDALNAAVLRLRTHLWVHSVAILAVVGATQL